MEHEMQHTTTALRRWSCQDRSLPAVNTIQHVHIYDFDNTLFFTPLPNRQLWAGMTCGNIQTQEFLQHGGWWHNPAILSATGKGIDVEEGQAWKGHWNEKIVDLVRLSMADENTLTVLLTGRSEQGFTDLLGRMLSSKSLVFDLVGLKPKVSPTGATFASTLAFKEAFLREVMFTYASATELRIYEDRPKHVKSFENFFEKLNQSLKTAQNPDRPPFIAHVIPVNEQDVCLDPTIEVATVQTMINTHNQAILDGTAAPGSTPYKIKKTVFFTGYLISLEDTEKLRSLVQLPSSYPEHELRYLANSILISTHLMSPSISERVGGLGAKLSWRVTGVACLDQRLWAARVQPVHDGVSYYTDSKTPFVVLATRRQTKPSEGRLIRDWQPVPPNQAIEFETTVGEKAMFSIDEEYNSGNENSADFSDSRHARKPFRDDDFPSLGSKRVDGSRFQSRGGRRAGGNRHGDAWSGRGGVAGQPYSHRGGGGSGDNSRGTYRGGNSFGYRGRRAGGRGNSRGGVRGNYKSLDDSSGRTYDSGGMQY